MEDREEITREQYIEWRQNNDQAEILRAWFNRKSHFQVDTANFFAIMFNVLEDHPGLQEDIDARYKEILLFYDKHFGINFLTKDYGDTRVLIMAY